MLGTETQLMTCGILSSHGSDSPGDGGNMHL
jgi:hypothetical protein